MKNQKNLLIILSIVLVIISCKKASIVPVEVTLKETIDKQFDGTYICTNQIVGLQGDTIKITSTNIKTTIKGFANVYNFTSASCGAISIQDYEVANDIVIQTKSKIYANVLQLTATVNVQDISISCCNGNQLNFKKIN